MKLLKFLIYFVALGATSLAAPTNVTEFGLAARGPNDHDVIACDVGHRLPCEYLPVVIGGSGFCWPITHGDQGGVVARHAKSFILPSSRPSSWHCWFFAQNNCQGSDSCYVRETEPDSGCRYEYQSYQCIDDMEGAVGGHGY